MKRKWIAAMMSAALLGSAVTLSAAAADFSLPVDGAEVTVTDNTALDIQEASLDTEEKAEDEEGDTYLLLDKDENKHRFTGVTLKELTEISVLERIGFVYFKGTSPEGKNVYFAEEGEEVTLKESEMMYALAVVNIREKPNPEGSVLAKAAVGSEVEVLGGTPEWFHIKQGDIEGYMAQQYLTDDKKEADEAVEKAEAERAAQEAAAAAAAVSGQGGGGGNACAEGAFLE